MLRMHVCELTVSDIRKKCGKVRDSNNSAAEVLSKETSDLLLGEVWTFLKEQEIMIENQNTSKILNQYRKLMFLTLKGLL